MTLVASVNYTTKRIYLSAATVGTSIDTLDIYREVRALRRTTDVHQQFRPMIVAGGNVTKVTGVSSTPSYVQLLYGCRIVPYNTSHSLKVIRDTFTDDGFAGRDCFDRTPLSPTVAVDIDVDFPEIENRFISGGGSAPTAAQNATAVWTYLLGTMDPGTAGKILQMAQINAANAFAVAASK
jgi:hypothetical protein